MEAGGNSVLQRRWLASSSFAACLLLVLTGFPVGFFSAHAEIDHVLREAFSIEGNSEFTIENGVVDGNGTADDPYIISGWEIASSPEYYTICLRSTDKHVVIRDCYFHASTYWGVELFWVSNVSLQDCVIFGSTYGVHGTNVTDSSVLRNDMDVLSIGVGITGGHTIAISGNSVILRHDLDNGILIQDVEGTIITDNILPEVGVFFTGNHTQWMALSMSGNTANGTPILFHSGESGLQITSGTFGQLFIVNCSDVRIAGLDVSGSNRLISIAHCDHITVEDSKFVGHREAVRIESSKLVIVVGNSFEPSAWALTVLRCDEVQVIGNIVTGGDRGICVGYCTNFQVAENDMLGNYYGLYCVAASHGEVAQNRIWDCMVGVYAYVINPYYVIEADHVRFFSNSFIQNTEVSDDRSALNWWNASYPVGGNYYDDYAGVDVMSGPEQDQPGIDGIGDTPYWITSDMADLYPLMAPPAQSNGSPVAHLSVSPVQGDLMTDFTFDASLTWDAMDEPGELQFRWDWEGDGTWDTDWGSGTIAYHQFASSGHYTVLLEVRDTDGFTDMAEVNVEVWNVVPEFKAQVVPVLLLMLVVIIARNRPKRTFM